MVALIALVSAAAVQQQAEPLALPATTLRSVACTCFLPSCSSFRPPRRPDEEALQATGDDDDDDDDDDDNADAVTRGCFPDSGFDSPRILRMWKHRGRGQAALSEVATHVGHLRLVELVCTRGQWDFVLKWWSGGHQREKKRRRREKERAVFQALQSPFHI
ncbi:hypothetical protein IWX91DRAFT_323960 [Phyllosticta citricarpa]